MRKFRVHAATSDLLVEVKKVLSQYGNAITVRQAYYRLVANLTIPNSMKSYKRLVAHLTSWRKEGALNPRSFIDLTRRPDFNGGWDDLAHYLRSVQHDYRRDYWVDQNLKPEIWLEKQALATVFMPVCEDWQVTLQVCRGYPSISTLVGARDRGITDIIYFGDWDPSGADIDRSIADEMHSTWRHALTINRLALTPEQIIDYSLPPIPPKDTDSRTNAFVAEHGEDCVELDALPPDSLKDLIVDAINKYIDNPDGWAAAKQAEVRDQQRLNTYIQSLSDSEADHDAEEDDD